MPAAPLDTAILQASVDAWARHDRSQTKAAGELGISPGTLKSRLLNARSRGITPGKQRIRVKAETRTASMASPPMTPSASARREPPAPERHTINQRVLTISDLHCPYHHCDALEFLNAIKKKYNPDKVVNIGDELDHHDMSFHDSDPDLDSAGRELQRGSEVLWELEKMFPEMDLVDSNHGSMAYRRAKAHGIPRHLVLSYRDAIFGERGRDGNLTRPGDRGIGWRWHPELVLDLPGNKRCLFVHGRAQRTLTNVQQCGMNFVQGHHHSTFEIVYNGTPDALNFGMTVGCLIDDGAMAFSYNRNTMKRPIIGCGIIIDGFPKLLPMMLQKGTRRWTGFVP